MAPPVDGRADFKVHEIKTMGKSNDAEAKAILTRVTSQVRPGAVTCYERARFSKVLGRGT